MWQEFLVTPAGHSTARTCQWLAEWGGVANWFDCAAAMVRPFLPRQRGKSNCWPETSNWAKTWSKTTGWITTCSELKMKNVEMLSGDYERIVA
jgi:hypothetical protein